MSTNTKKSLLGVGLLALLPLTACVAPEDVQVTDPPPPGVASAGEEHTYDHPEISTDVWRIMQRLAKEGPPEYNARVHGCPKIKYAALGTMLTSRGVDLASGGGVSAGRIYRESDLALGIANYGARKPEAVELTASSAAKLFEIFLQAAPEWIANMPARPECMVDGVGAVLINEDDTCNATGITCLTGVPATATQVELCSQIIQRATTPEKGRIIAVAAVAAAAHTCE